MTIDLYPFHVLHPEVFSSCGDPRLVSQKKYLESRVEGLGLEIPRFQG